MFGSLCEYVPQLSDPVYIQFSISSSSRQVSVVFRWIGRRVDAFIFTFTFQQQIYTRQIENDSHLEGTDL
jgi:SMC interacting uncharacterized protein involved in chromosome segregation